MYSLSSGGGRPRLPSRFVVGGRNWHIDYYPNGTNGTKDSEYDAITLHLRVAAGYQRERVLAEFKFNLLDPSGNTAYELASLMNVFTTPARQHHHETEGVGTGFGLAEFVMKEELERRRETLLKDDCLAIRCDASASPSWASWPSLLRRSVTTMPGTMTPAGRARGASTSSRRRRQPLDDKEYIRRSLAKNRRA
ncbi:hypothetical protein BAE44_0006518 [Dichanthelium oligosanthes]|uniref:MATH domain-containing protein n=1 Tax=Dichanthelium oligosanthes TaxID=888268 RepID=A0A1E5W4X5_9POAL|nr:hypothetical protein BAE44_0006518 [Dichanthelium oligosanthes]